MDSPNERVSCLVEKKSVRKRSRFELESDLPTPPPPPPPLPTDPIHESNLIKSTIDRSVTLNVENAFERLSKLYALVEEIIEIRDKNSKLFKRVRELERVKASRKAQSELERSISAGQDVFLPDEDVGFAESLLGAMLSSGFDQPRRGSNISRASSSRRRDGNISVGLEHRRVSCPVVAGQESLYRRNSSRVLKNTPPPIKRPSMVFGQPKVSKWTRVKAAFKWEKAVCNNSETIVNQNNSDTTVRYLRIPYNNINTATSSEISAPATPVGTISSSSSIDDVFHRSHRTCNTQPRIARRDAVEEKSDSDPSRRSRSLDGEITTPMMTFVHEHPRRKDNLHAGKIEYRTHKTPWGKMKDIMQLRRDSLGRQVSTRNSRHEDNHSTSSLDSTDVHRADHDGRLPRVRITSDPSQSTTSGKKFGTKALEIVDLASRRLTPTLTITVPSSEELRSISSPESITPPLPPLAQRQMSESGRSDKSVRSQCSPILTSNPGINRYALGRSRTSQGVPDDFRRQQSLKGESLGSSPKMQRRNSKWNKVKRALLTGATSVPTSPSRISSYFFDDGDATGGSYSASASAEDLDNDGSSNPAVQAEIQRNYRLLHDKLGTEFYRKLAEWEKLKAAKDSRSSHREKELQCIHLLSEERLTPEFKKKLEEWKQISKGSVSNEPRSVSKRRITDWQLWKSSPKCENKTDSMIPNRLSEDFIKKMDEWKKIKSVSRQIEETEIKRPETEEEKMKEEEVTCPFEVQPRSMTRLDGWRGFDDEEFECLDRIIGAMESERQTRLSKLHRVVGSAPEKTQEILIHTSTGFYRFEGISKNFTRKLYEWEKSQGIAPELSTFRLLDPLRYGISSNPRTSSNTFIHKQLVRPSFSRSKSVGSLLVESWRTTREVKLATPAGRRQSSLSLNDIESLELRNCIVGSIPDVEDNLDDGALEDLELETEIEPEAMIIDIEDVIEETASPLTKLQPHQTPVYSVAGSERTSIAIPLGTVTSMHEPSPVILVEPGEIHPISVNDESLEVHMRFAVVQPAPSLHRDSSAVCASRNCSIEDRLFENETPLGNGRLIGNIPIEGLEENTSLDDGYKTIFDKLCAERQVPPHNSGIESARAEVAANYFSGRDNHLIAEEEDITEAVITVAGHQKQSRHHLKTRRLTDTQVGYAWYQNSSFHKPQDTKSNGEEIGKYIQVPDFEKIKINESTLNRIVVPTSSGTLDTSGSLLKNDKFESSCGDGSGTKKIHREPINVFVKTKQIVFAPFKRANRIKNDQESPVDAPDNVENNFHTSERSPIDIPQSPILSRKEYKNVHSYLPKETAPNIKMMIKKYNEKLEGCGGILPGLSTGSGTSSGSSSPIWRSPVTNRRITTRMEKYQEEVRKAIAGPKYSPEVRKNQNSQSVEIRKSATIDSIPDSKKPDLESESTANCVLRSETMPAVISGNHMAEKSEFISNVNKLKKLHSSRALMIEKAKQDFFQLDQSQFGESDNRDDEDIPNLSKADLIKSASAGMINIDSDTFEKLQLSSGESSTSNRGYDSLPRSTDQLRQQVQKCGKESRFQQLTSKFKRARFKRSRDKEISGMSTVSKLCRQSLFVDIASGETKSCPTTPSPQNSEHYNYPRKASED